jgi:hypothetical protein
MRSRPSRDRLLDRTVPQSFALPIDGPEIHPSDGVLTLVSEGDPNPSTHIPWIGVYVDA